ncbi:hypothetical protein NC652_031551 [Populus alba x Populus x berolinensis]|nr:hypothetical protein NC652_031551 [Populus alba x Populus x berolinensis]
MFGPLSAYPTTHNHVLVISKILSFLPPYPPPLHTPPQTNSFSFPLTSIPVSTLNQKYPLKFFSNRNWVCLRKTNFMSNLLILIQLKVSQLLSEWRTSSSSSTTSFLSFLCPLLKLFSGGDPSQERNYSLEVSNVFRVFLGTTSIGDQEACPFCRRVREAMTELDLSAEFVSEEGHIFRFPFLVDPNTGVSIYESGDIVKYLFQQYGKGRSPSMGLLESTLFTGWMPTILRAGRGMTLWEKARLDPPSKKLELFSFENNPYARLVREALCELELPYILQNVGTGLSEQSY